LSTLIALSDKTEGVHEEGAVIIGRVEYVAKCVASFDNSGCSFSSKRKVRLNNPYGGFRNENFADDHLVGERVEEDEIERVVREHEVQGVVEDLVTALAITGK
jgi:hypothetical protein